MFCTKSAPWPCWATIQNVSPCRPSQTGVTRGRPVRRPVVSRRASPGGGIRSANASLSSGLSTDFWSRSVTRCLSPDAPERPVG